MDALARIKDKVARVPKGDAPYLLNKGAKPEEYVKHKGCLNPVLSQEDLVAFERKHRITLPEEYRTFLREVGNGGLGPGNGLSTVAEAAQHSPTRDLDKPFPFSFRLYEEKKYSWEELEYAQPGVLYLATPDEPWASVYLVITGEDRGMVWMYGPIHGGWNPEAPTWEEDEKQIGKPPRSFFRWYEDWLDAILSIKIC